MSAKWFSYLDSYVVLMMSDSCRHLSDQSDNALEACYMLKQEVFPSACIVLLQSSYKMNVSFWGRCVVFLWRIAQPAPAVLVPRSTLTCEWNKEQRDMFSFEGQMKHFHVEVGAFLCRIGYLLGIHTHRHAHTHAHTHRGIVNAGVPRWENCWCDAHFVPRWHCQATCK